MSQSKSIRDFFKPHADVEPAAVPTATTREPPPKFKVPSVPAQLPPIRPSDVPPTASASQDSDQQPSCSSSLSSPPSSNEFVSLSDNKSAQVLSRLAEHLSERVINDSDEEDSDSSLEDLTLLLAARHPSAVSRPKTSAGRAKTPPRYQTRTNKLPPSPLAVLPKYKFDLKTLIAQKESDEAAEASSKRFKAMLETEDDEDVAMDGDSVAKDHGALLESIVAEREDGDADRINRALRRTEATVGDQRWYFFETQAEPVKPEREPFPVALIPEGWMSMLADPQMRQQAFVSGFVEDMVAMGKGLPDELFIWILDEVAIESNGPLRTSYLNLSRHCSEQSQRLITTGKIEKIFRSLGGTARATTLNETLRPVQRLPDPYPNRDWAKLLSVIKWFGQLADVLNQRSRTRVICMLLRLSVDKIVFENVDIHDSIQQAMARLCHYIPEDVWDASVRSLLLPIYHPPNNSLQCYRICQSLFDATREPSLRLQAIDSIPSTTARTHDLRRRLATSSFFDSLFYAKTHSHTNMSLDAIIDRLADPIFDTRPSTKYRELAALLNLLDIAVDDGKSLSLDLTVKKVEEKYNRDIEELSATINSIMSGISTAGASNISRMEAKSSADSVSKRIAVTLRTKRKPKEQWFERKREEGFEREKKSMASFLAKKVVKGV